MRRASICTAALALIATPLAAGPNGVVTGEYVEARTAEVFTGGCIMGSEAETAGRHAVMAWRIDRGAVNGVALDGLSVVAAVTADRNLGISEIGGVAPNRVKVAVLTDARATTTQQEALVALARDLSGGLFQDIVEVSAVPISFDRSAENVVVTAGDAHLTVETRVEHDPSCGAMQWFHPLSAGTEAAIGTTKKQIYAGSSLGSKWEQTDKKSAFFGTFNY